MTVKDFVKWIYPASCRMGEISPVFDYGQAHWNQDGASQLLENIICLV